MENQFRNVSCLTPRVKVKEGISGDLLGVESCKQLEYLVVQDDFESYTPSTASIDQIKKQINRFTSFLHEEVKCAFLEKEIFFSEKYGRDRNEPLDLANFNLEFLDHKKLVSVVCELICFLRDFEHHLINCEKCHQSN